MAESDVERFRPLLPVGYDAVARAYRTAVESLTPRDLTTHYTEGLRYFRETFVPHLKRVLAELSGGAWSLDDFEAYAAGSDVDLMTHLVEAVAAEGRVRLFPGDWYGFLVGCTRTENIAWDASTPGELACLCVPSVRNGHLTDEMADFAAASEACLLNLNLFPTLAAEERRRIAGRLSGVLDRAVLSISFSRGFGLTASQLGVFLVHHDHPYRRRFARQWDWLTYFHNALAARAFLAVDLAELQAVDEARRQWVQGWLEQHGLPAVATGSYYVKSFRLDATAATAGVPDPLRPLTRDGLVRLCFKPPQTGASA